MSSESNDFIGNFSEIFKNGERVILELKCKEIYEGIYVDGTKDHIVLVDVLQHNNKNKLGGNYEFYRSEIKEIYIFKPSPLGLPLQKASVTSTRCKIINVSEEDHFRLKAMTENYVYLENCDKRYYDAIEVLNNVENIGVVVLGMANQRIRSFINLLVLCTWKQVFIFDFIDGKARKLPTEITDLFKNPYICKVIHKSGLLVDVLFRQHDVYVENTFDTQLVDLMLQKRDSANVSATETIERNLSDCVVHYLNFPPSLLGPVLEIPYEKWNKRPMKEELKLYASQLVTYLFVLKHHMEKLLLENVYSTITKVQDCVSLLEPSEFKEYVTGTKLSNKISNLILDVQNMKIEKN